MKNTRTVQCPKCGHSVPIPGVFPSLPPGFASKKPETFLTRCGGCKNTIVVDLQEDRGQTQE